MWNKIKTWFKSFVSHPSVPAFTEIVVSSYYMGLGIMLSLMTGNLVVFLIFACPALLWYTIAFSHILNTEYTLTCLQDV